MKKMSIFENRLFEFLELQNIPFQREYKNETLVNDKGYNLYIDFYLPQYKIAIEINGLHHYQPVMNYSGDIENNFQRQLINDKCKRDWCKNNNIKLIVFDVRDDWKYLFKLILRRIKKKSDKIKKDIYNKNEKLNQKNNKKN